VTTQPIIQLTGAQLILGGRTLWDELSLSVSRGEFLAVLGPNGTGKTSFLRVLLGLSELTKGSAEVAGQRPHRGNQIIGYIPQQGSFDRDVTLRGRDLVRLGLDGHRYGPSWNTLAIQKQVNLALEAVGATAYADVSVGLLSGGEQQRLRVAQALVGDPALLLCDEPLLSLDLARQQAITELIDKRRREANTAVVFVTHEINPILPYVDRVLYLVGGRWAVGKPRDVLTTKRLTDLYGTPVDVLEVRGRIIVVGGTEVTANAHHEHSASKVMNR
jgi:zinc/manganese transport system ATP-binding protein